MANGDIPQGQLEAPNAKGRRRAKRATAILTGVRVADSIGADILVAGRCAGLLTHSSAEECLQPPNRRRKPHRATG